MSARSTVFVSPHLDDAVFACGDRIAAVRNAIVVTVFAGSALDRDTLTPWDAECGFGAGDDVVALRRQEDGAALRCLGAQPLWLDFRDDQYGEPRTTGDISRAIETVLQANRVETVYVPLGLFHSDHRRASDAALALVRADAAWFAYADAIYRRIPGIVDERIGRLREAGCVLDALPVDVNGPSTRKREAVACYASQLRALGTRPAHDDMLEPERYWRVTTAAR